MSTLLKIRIHRPGELIEHSAISSNIFTVCWEIHCASCNNEASVCDESGYWHKAAAAYHFTNPYGPWEPHWYEIDPHRYICPSCWKYGPPTPNQMMLSDVNAN